MSDEESQEFLLAGQSVSHFSPITSALRKCQTEWSDARNALRRTHGGSTLETVKLGGGSRFDYSPHKLDTSFLNRTLPSGLGGGFDEEYVNADIEAKIAATINADAPDILASRPQRALGTEFEPPLSWKKNLMKRPKWNRVNYLEKAGPVLADRATVMQVFQQNHVFELSQDRRRVEKRVQLQNQRRASSRSTTCATSRNAIASPSQGDRPVSTAHQPAAAVGDRPVSTTYPPSSAGGDRPVSTTHPPSTASATAGDGRAGDLLAPESRRASTSQTSTSQASQRKASQTSNYEQSASRSSTTEPPSDPRQASTTERGSSSQARQAPKRTSGVDDDGVVPRAASPRNDARHSKASNNPRGHNGSSSLLHGPPSSTPTPNCGTISPTSRQPRWNRPLRGHPDPAAASPERHIHRRAPMDPAAAENAVLDILQYYEEIGEGPPAMGFSQLLEMTLADPGFVPPQNSRSVGGTVANRRVFHASPASEIVSCNSPLGSRAEVLLNSRHKPMLRQAGRVLNKVDLGLG